MRPGSVAPLPVSTASTGLLCLSVGAHVHHSRSNTKVEHIATTMCIPHLVHDICVIKLYIYVCPVLPKSVSNFVLRDDSFLLLNKKI